MLWLRRIAGVCLAAGSLCWLTSCGGPTCRPVTLGAASFAASGTLSFPAQAVDPLTTYDFAGNTDPVLDPSVIRAGSTYYAFSTDVASAAYSLPIRCSTDKVNWTLCGSVFPHGAPSWASQLVPGIQGLWAPDISYFNGEYHVYYAGSTFASQRSFIALATNKTLDSSDPHYKWVDRGPVMVSNPGDNFNAIDPTLLVDRDGTVWMTYGSSHTGIKQRQVDPATGQLIVANCTCYSLATRPGVKGNPIEGPSLVRHGNFYYLFVSMDYCCANFNTTIAYKEAVGRSTSFHGPFVDANGTAMMNGGGTVLLEEDSAWTAPGGGTAYIDSSTGESLIIFHAHDSSQSETPYQWVKSLKWVNDWPVIAN
ncbi:MAG TPA: arabinan endo-1,5-alpha-L-arabinosidase [Terracidiphilus sp.]|nr:arabinan endo-1,5-alpha-L-arabinosidase [Terracidiphilus sp.]